MNIDDFTHVFIIRIWGELREKPGEPPEWRGTIEHLQSKRQVYIKDLDKIGMFISPYLEEMGIMSSKQKKRSNIFRRTFDCLWRVKRSE